MYGQWHSSDVPIWAAVRSLAVALFLTLLFLPPSSFLKVMGRERRWPEVVIE
jgi:hypothetical protein